MICIVKLTFWSLPLIWLAIGLLSVAVALVGVAVIRLDDKFRRLRHTFYTPKEVAAILELQEYNHKIEGRHPSLNAIINELKETEKGDAE